MIVGNYFLHKMAIKHAHSHMLTLGGMCIPNILYRRSRISVGLAWVHIDTSY